MASVAAGFDETAWNDFAVDYLSQTSFPAAIDGNFVDNYHAESTALCATETQADPRASPEIATQSTSAASCSPDTETNEEIVCYGMAGVLLPTCSAHLTGP